MARLPIPGGDQGNWGEVLNEFLSQTHEDDGSLKKIAKDKLSDEVQTSLDKADAALDEPTAQSVIASAISDPGSALARAMVEPLAYQDFRGVADGPPTTLDTGQPWVLQAGSGGTASLPTVIAGALTNDVTEGATAGHAEVDLGAPITRIGARVTFGPYSGPQGVAALAIWHTTHVIGNTYTPLHLTINPERIQIDIGGPGGGSLETIAVETFSEPLIADATTEYVVEAQIDGGTITVYCSNGTTLQVSDDRVALYAGPIADWEIYAANAALGTKVRFAEVWADTRVLRDRQRDVSLKTVTRIAQGVAAAPLPAIVKVFSPDPAADVTIPDGTSADAVSLSTSLNVTTTFPASGKLLVEFTVFLVVVGSATVYIRVNSVGVMVANAAMAGPVHGGHLLTGSPGDEITIVLTTYRVGGTSATIKASQPTGVKPWVKVTGLTQ